MTMEVLVSTMNRQDYSLLDKMNIQTNCVVVNQCDHDDVVYFTRNGYQVTWISMSRRGVGLSRNTALMYATADIVLFADDDMVYYAGYEEAVLKAFHEHSSADVICFNLDLVDRQKGYLGGKYCRKARKLHLYNMLRYGAPTIAARRKTIFSNRIAFSLLFGGGAPFSSGEDSLFLLDCKSRGLNLRAEPYVLAEVDQTTSTWFQGYTDKYFVDKGRFYYSAFPTSYPLFFIYYALRFSKLSERHSIMQILSLFAKGKNEMRNYR